MNSFYYQEQVMQITARVYPDQELCARIRAARKVIDQQFSGEVCLDELAAAACVSRFHFIRLFKKHYGRTPWHYLTEVRIKAAKQMLAAGFRVTEVCFSVGFDSPTSFSGLFRKVTGISPQAYQRKVRLQKSNIGEAAH